MSPEAQRIAIAEACGWVWNILKDDGLWWVFRPTGGGAGMTTEITPEYFFSVFTIPDYLHDLNAMHEAEKTLEKDSAFSPHYYYQSALRDACGDVWLAIHATAPQRAEAFLRTIGKWVESPNPPPPPVPPGETS